MISSTEPVRLAGHTIAAPSRWDGRPSEPGDMLTATQIAECDAKAGVLVYRLGVINSAVYGPVEDVQIDPVEFHKLKLHADGCTALLRHTNGELTGGPTVYHIDAIYHTMHALTPLLVPDRMHLEHLQDILNKTILPSNEIANALAHVQRVRAERALVA